MAARSMCLVAVALICAAALVQVSSGSCLRRNKCPYSFIPESYQEECPCVRKPVEKQEFDVYSGVPAMHTPYKTHYCKTEVPEEEPEEPFVAMEYGLQVPSQKREYLRCSCHGYKVEVPEPEEGTPTNAYGYLVTEPRQSTHCQRKLEYPVEVETPRRETCEKSTSYGYAVAVPKRKFRPCVSQSYDYQIEAPPTEPEDERFAYGIAVQKFQEPSKCYPYVDNCPIPHVPPPRQKPCVPFEDNYVPPEPEVSVVIHKKPRVHSSCKDEGGSHYRFGSARHSSRGSCEPRYEQESEDQGTYEVSSDLWDGGAASYEDESPIPGGSLYSQVSVVDDGEMGVDSDDRGESNWEVSSVTSSHGDRHCEDGVSYGSGETDDQVDSQSDYGSVAYSSSPYYSNSLYHTFLSKPTGWGKGSDVVVEEVGSGDCSERVSSDDGSSYGGVSSWDSQGYVSAVNYGGDSREDGVEKETSTVYSSVSPSSSSSYDQYEAEGSYEDDGMGSISYSGRKCNSPVQLSLAEVEDPGSYEQENLGSESYDDVSSYSNDQYSRGYDQENYEEPGSYEVEGKAADTYDDSDSYSGVQFSNINNYQNYEDPGSYEQESVGSEAYDGITSYSFPQHTSSCKHETYDDDNNNAQEEMESVAYGSIKSHSLGELPVSYTHESYVDPVGYGNVQDEQEAYADVSYSMVQPNVGYQREKYEVPGSYEQDAVESIDYGKVNPHSAISYPSTYKYDEYEDAGVYNQDDVSSVSYGNKNSYSPVKYSSTISHGKYENAVSYGSRGSVSYGSGEIYSPVNYPVITPNYEPYHGTPVATSYVPLSFPNHYPQPEYKKVVGHNLYEEIQTGGHFSGTFSHGGAHFKATDYSPLSAQDEKFEGGDGEETFEYSEGKNVYEESAENKVRKGGYEEDGTTNLEKKVVVVKEDPYGQEEEKVTIEKVETVKVNSKEIVREEVTDYVPEKETVVTKVIGSGEKLDKKVSVEYIEEPEKIKEVILKKIYSSSERDLIHGGSQGEKELEVVTYAKEPVQHEIRRIDDRERVNVVHGKVGGYEVVRKLVSNQGDIVEKEESTVLDTFGKNSGRVVVVEEEEGNEAEVIVEGEPEVVLEKEVLVVEEDGYGGERVVSKEIIKKVRPAVAVEVTVDEPTHGKVHTYKKTYSSEYVPRGSYESAQVINRVKSSSHEEPIVEKVLISPSKNEEVEQVVEEFVVPGDREGPYHGKHATEIYSGDSYGKDEVSSVRTAQLEKILKEENPDEVEYIPSTYISGEKYKNVVSVRKGPSVEIIAARPGSKEVVREEYVDPKGVVYTKSYEVTGRSTLAPGPQKTVIVTKTTSTDYQHPKYEHGHVKEGDEYVGVTLKKYTQNQYEPEDPQLYAKVSTEYPTAHKHSHQPHHRVVLTKKSSTEYSTPKFETEPVYEDGEYKSVTYAGEKHSHTHKPTETIIVTKETTEYDVPKHDGLLVKEVRKLVSPKEYVNTVSVEKTTIPYTSHERYPDKDPSTEYVQVTKSHEIEPDVTKKVVVSNEQSDPIEKSYEGEDSYIGAVHKSYGSETVKYKPTNPHHQSVKHKYWRGGEVTVSTHSRPSHSREVYTEVTKETTIPEDPKPASREIVYEKGHLLKKPTYGREEVVVTYGGQGEVSRDGGEETVIREYSRKPYLVNPIRPKYHSYEEPTEIRSAVSGKPVNVAYQQSSEMRGRVDGDYDAAQGGSDLSGGYTYSGVQSGAEALESSRSGYQAVRVQGSGGETYYGGRSEGYGEMGGYYKSDPYRYSSGGDSARQGYDGAYYQGSDAYGKSSRGSMSQSYSTEGGMASASGSHRIMEEQNSVNGYESGGVRSFVIRQAHGNVKKSSGYHRFEQRVSSSTGESDHYIQERSAEP